MGLCPSLDTVKVEYVVACSPSLIALVLVRDLTCLTVDAGFHNMILADGTIVYLDVPGPHDYCIPFLNLIQFLCCGADHDELLKISSLFFILSKRL